MSRNQKLVRKSITAKTLRAARDISKIWRATSMHALKVKAASLNCMCHSSGSQWSCSRSALEENGGRELWPAHDGLASKQYHTRQNSSYPGAMKQALMQQKQPRMNGLLQKIEYDKNRNWIVPCLSMKSHCLIGIESTGNTKNWAMHISFQPQSHSCFLH